MVPKYITVHSTSDHEHDAHDFSVLMAQGKLNSKKRPGAVKAGKLSWHFTVQDNLVVQHLSTREQGGHADFNGPGNRTSIGIEMCQHRGNNLSATIERTARLVGKLMRDHGIPLSNVVPHYHWPRPGVTPYRKACPEILMDNGKPGAKWQRFLGRCKYHYLYGT
jgi:N-acetylmuramoyl-L-alanine amidase